MLAPMVLDAGSRDGVHCAGKADQLVAHSSAIGSIMCWLSFGTPSFTVAFNAQTLRLIARIEKKTTTEFPSASRSPRAVDPTFLGRGLLGLRVRVFRRH
jgi:hypothetical protein